MLACKRFLNSNLTNFPETIWLMIFVGPGEKPGPTTKGWCKTGRGVVSMLVLSSSTGTKKVEQALNADVESDKVHNSSSTGWVQNQTKVFTNEGTTKDCILVHWALKGIGALREAFPTSTIYHCSGSRQASWGSSRWSRNNWDMTDIIQWIQVLNQMMRNLKWMTEVSKNQQISQVVNCNDLQRLAKQSKAELRYAITYNPLQTCGPFCRSLPAWGSTAELLLAKLNTSFSLGNSLELKSSNKVILFLQVCSRHQYCTRRLIHNIPLAAYWHFCIL